MPSLREQLIHYWPFDSAQGDSPLDVVQNDNTEVVAAGTMEYATGIRGDGIRIRQTADDDLRKQGATRNRFATEQWSISAWINPAARDAMNAIISQETAPSASFTTPEFNIYGDVNGAINFQVKDGDSQIGLITSANDAAPLSTWTHVAAVFDQAGRIELFINGVSVGTDTFTAIDFTTAKSRFSIGSVDTNDFLGPENFDGTIDEVAIWKRVLEDWEIRNLYNDGNGLFDFHVFTDDATRTPLPMLFARSPGEPKDEMMDFLFPKEMPKPKRPPKPPTTFRPKPPRR